MIRDLLAVAASDRREFIASTALTIEFVVTFAALWIFFP